MKPIGLSDDNEHLDVQFFWLRPYRHTSGVNLLWPPFLPADLSEGPNNVKLFDCASERKIRSGETISLRPDDPERGPLPSFALLEMQWILQRMAALSGAANKHSSSFDDDDGSVTLNDEWDPDADEAEYQ